MANPPFILAFLDGLGGPEMLVIFVLALMLFGGKKLPELARSVGKSVREFKRAAAGVEQEIRRAMDTEAPPVRPTPPPRPKPPITAALPAAAASSLVATEADASLDETSDDTHKDSDHHGFDHDEALYNYDEDHQDLATPSAHAEETVDEAFEAGDPTDLDKEGASDPPKKKT